METARRPLLKTGYGRGDESSLLPLLLVERVHNDEPQETPEADTEPLGLGGHLAMSLSVNGHLHGDLLASKKGQPAWDPLRAMFLSLPVNMQQELIHNHGNAVGKWAKSLSSGQFNSTGAGSPIITPKFHLGGIIPGILGQDRLINAMAGEEVLNRGDPRHSFNFGKGINVNINVGSMSSDLDVEETARKVGQILMTEIKQIATVPA